MLDANAAWEKALEVGDPALQVRVLAPLLQNTGEDRLLHETASRCRQESCGTPTRFARGF
jgi:hypothetical protein